MQNQHDKGGGNHSRTKDLNLRAIRLIHNVYRAHKIGKRAKDIFEPVKYSLPSEFDKILDSFRYSWTFPVAILA